MRFAMLRDGKRTGEVMVNIVTNYGEFPDAESFVEKLRAAFPQVTSVAHNQNGQKSNIATGEIETILFGPGYIEEEIQETVLVTFSFGIALGVLLGLVVFKLGGIAIGLYVVYHLMHLTWRNVHTDLVPR